MTNPDAQPAKTDPRRPNRRWIRNGFVAVAIGYVLVLIGLVANETALVYPASKFPQGNWSPANFAFEEVQFKAADSTKLVGWYLPRPESLSVDPPEAGTGDEKQGRLCETVLLCHGNAENCAEAACYNGELLRTTLNADVFVFDYRGYGKSEGTPSEAGVLDDAEHALKWICQKTQKSPSEIVIVGHSIGGGPACFLASRFGCKALVLQRTFKSLAETAQYNYPMFPVRYLMKNQFPSKERIKGYDGPVFQSHGSEDKLIPLEHAKELFANASTSQKTFYEIPGMGHYDGWPAEYWHQLREFLEAVLVNETATQNESAKQ
jgi:pimeloyl-ACP methyl ester carboxylesterase